jgi:DNA-nicking Smr family endonuclease
MKTLDLHRMKHEDAYRAVDKFIDRNYADDSQLKIITGHSKDMREIVITIVTRLYSLSYKIGGPIGVDDSFIVIN